MKRFQSKLSKNVQNKIKKRKCFSFFFNRSKTSSWQPSIRLVMSASVSVTGCPLVFARIYSQRDWNRADTRHSWHLSCVNATLDKNLILLKINIISPTRGKKQILNFYIFFDLKISGLIHQALNFEGMERRKIHSAKIVGDCYFGAQGLFDVS